MEAPRASRATRWSTWMSCWTAASLPLVYLGLLLGEPATLLSIAFTVALPVMVVLVLLDQGGDGSGTTRSARGWLWSGRLVLCVVALALSAVVTSSVHPALGWLLVLVAALTTPRAFDAWSGRVRDSAGREAALPSHLAPLGTAAPRLTGSVRGLSDAELCVAWRDSFWDLREAPTSALSLGVVLRRKALLDEFEARNSAAVAAWIESGAGAATVPKCFIHEGRGDAAAG